MGLIYCKDYSDQCKIGTLQEHMFHDKETGFNLACQLREGHAGPHRDEYSQHVWK